MDKDLSVREALRVTAQLREGHKGKLLAILAVYFLLSTPALSLYDSLNKFGAGDTASGWRLFASGLIGLIALITIITRYFGLSWAPSYEALARINNEVE